MKQIVTIKLTNGEIISVETEADTKVRLEGYLVEMIEEEKETLYEKEDEEIQEILNGYKEYVDKSELCETGFNDEADMDTLFMSYSKNSEKELYNAYYDYIGYTDETYTELEDMACNIAKYPDKYEWFINYAKNSYNQLKEDYIKLCSTANKLEKDILKTRLFLREEMHGLKLEIEGYGLNLKTGEIIKRPRLKKHKRD